MKSAKSETPASKRRWRMSRRKFLIGLGATGGALAIGVAAGLPYGRLKLAEMIDSGGGGFFSMPNDPWAWFEVGRDGRITPLHQQSRDGTGRPHGHQTNCR